MESRDIKGELARISAIMDKWDGKADIPEVERALVLDKIKAIYERVMFLEGAAAAQDEAAAEETPVAAVPEPAVEEIADESPANEPVPVPVVEEPEVAPEPVAKPEPVAEPGPEPSFEPEAEPEVKPEAKPDGAVDGKLFDDEPLAASRTRVDRSIILSLYGDSPCPADKALVEVMQAGEAPGCAPEEPAQPKAVAVQESAKPVQSTPSQSRQIIGEVMGGGERLGDALSKQVHVSDVASKLASAQTQNLRKSIGINDKFLIISEVFAGNASAYEAAIDELDAFGDLDDLMIHIHDKYSWNPNNEGVKTLIEILTRKFS